MKQKLLLFHFFIQLTKGFYIFLVPLIFFQNCYFNPFVFSLLNPNLEDQKQSGLFNGTLALALNGLNGSINITGIIRDASGTAQIDKPFIVTNSESTVQGLDRSGTTDKSGRFYLSIGLGNTTIKVLDSNETLVTFTLNVSSPNSITVANVDPPTYEIGSFYPYDPGNTPNFFELVSSIPYQNQIFEGPPTLILIFSDTLPSWDFPTLSSIVSNNIIVSPSTLTLQSSSLGSNSIMTMTNVSAYDTEYTIQIGPGITSEKGIPLNPKTLKFTVVMPP